MIDSSSSKPKDRSEPVAGNEPDNKVQNDGHHLDKPVPLETENGPQNTQGGGAGEFYETAVPVVSKEPRAKTSNFLYSNDDDEDGFLSNAMNRVVESNEDEELRVDLERRGSDNRVQKEMQDNEKSVGDLMKIQLQPKVEHMIHFCPHTARNSL